jgi:hypothetical protein
VEIKKILTAIGLIITILISIQIPTITSKANTEVSVPFTDINNHWSKTTIQWAAEKGIAKGYENGTFKPDNQVTEAEFLTMLIRAYKPEMSKGIKNWSDPYYDYAKNMNYPVKGMDNIQLRNGLISRQQVAELVSATQGVHYELNDAIRYMYDKELAKGSNAQITISGYRASDTLTRAEAVQFVKNILDHGKGELLSRPEVISDISLLPDIPMGDTPTPAPTTVPVKPNYDLPYKPPAGWVPPKIKSVATDDLDKNYEILKAELGFTNGSIFNPYGIDAYQGVGSIGVGSTDAPYFSRLVFYYWNGSEKAPEKNKVPYVARELFKFYFPKDYNKLFKIMDDGYNGKDISNYIGKAFTLDSRQIKIIEHEHSVSIYIGKSIQ